MKEKLKNFIKSDFFYIFVIFITTRVLLIGLAILSRKVFQGPGSFQLSNWLDIFKIWDSEHYLDIAENGYSATKRTSIGAANYAFFPLYPIMIKFLSILTRSAQLAGVIISNACSLIGSYYLFKLFKEKLDIKAAKRGAKFLFLSPASFIMAAIFTESLFLMLLVLCFYFADKKQWWKVGLAGFFLSLTRSLGVWMVIPIFIEYIIETRKQGKVDFKKIIKESSWLILFPIGLTFFIIYNYHLTGDALAFVHIQEAWGHYASNPITLLWKGIRSYDERTLVNSLVTLVSLIYITINLKKLKLSYSIASYLLIIMPLTTGLVSLYNMIRYILPVFPIYYLLAIQSKNKEIEDYITIGLAVFLGAMVIFWSIGKIII